MSEIQTLQDAFQCHQSGDVQGAERLYQKVLQFNPDNAQALHLYGILAQQVNQYEAGLNLVKKAIEFAPENPEFLNTLGVIYRSMKDLNSALDVFQKALTFNEHYEDAILNLGVTQLDLGLYFDAVASFRRWVNISSKNPNAYYHLALALHREEMFEEAIRSYERAINLKPDFENASLNLFLLLGKTKGLDQAIARAKEYLRSFRSYKIQNLLANFLQQAEKWQAALDEYAQLLDFGDIPADPYINMSACYKELGDYDSAKKNLTRTLEKFPTSYEARFNLGTLLLDCKDYQNARLELEKALELRKSAEVLLNLGNVYTKTHAYDKAEACFLELLERDPKDIKTLFSMAVLLHERLELNSAEEYLNEILLIDPNNADAHSSLGFIALQREDYPRGWQEYEWRWKSPQFTSRIRRFKSSEWTGENLHGKSIFIASEQGYGDVLQFLRFVPMLKQRGASRVIVEVQDSLHSLVCSYPKVDQWVIKGDSIPEHDCYCHLMSLAQKLEIDSHSLPPVLELELAWDETYRLETTTANKNVGLVWAGNPKQVNDHNRSMCLESLIPVLGLEPINFYSFQVGERENEITELGLENKIVNLAPRINDFKDTAFFANQMDLIITVCTSMSHLMGFLNKPSWTLLCYNPDWRWGLDREYSRWYPKSRLFRQTTPGDWSSVVERVKLELEK